MNYPPRDPKNAIIGLYYPSFAPALLIKINGSPTFHIFFPVPHLWSIERDIEGPTFLYYLSYTLS